MILRELKRERVKDGRLWEMIDQANKLTAGSSYESWDDNIGALAPLMERILLYAREKEEWEMAIFWYETALKLTPPGETGAFVRWDYYGYLPEINLCVCYDHLGETRKAYEYHLKSRARKPEAREVKWNEQYFREKGMEEIRIV